MPFSRTMSSMRVLSYGRTLLRENCSERPMPFAANWAPTFCRITERLPAWFPLMDPLRWWTQTGVTCCACVEVARAAKLISFG